ncbi:hypothetical protein AAFF_G00107410 [Aldrovandia affinis]|uniref:Uncharacterized protein n=1 Tax=Aldrovandia affinis TaxID=143900 RepID=A0AAD7RU21_9TELE|nr:hypothetical protein AAFF_G00107410 [Aldrovandia affinis]
MVQTDGENAAGLPTSDCQNQTSSFRGKSGRGGFQWAPLDATYRSPFTALYRQLLPGPHWSQASCRVPHRSPPPPVRSRRAQRSNGHLVLKVWE